MTSSTVALAELVDYALATWRPDYIVHSGRAGGGGMVNLSEGPDGHVAQVVVPSPDGESVVGFVFERETVGGPLSVGDVLVHRRTERQTSGLSAKEIRSLPLGDLMALARHLAVERLEFEDQRGAEDARPPLGEARSPANLLNEAERDLLKLWREDRRGKGARTNYEYAALAWAFSVLRKHGVRNAAQELGRLTDASARVTSDRLRQARKLGLLEGDVATEEARFLVYSVRGVAQLLADESTN